MKKVLKKVKDGGLFYFDNSEWIEGKNPNMRGNCSRLYGNCSGLNGDCSGLKGDCSGLKGDCSGLYGNLKDCEITDEERIKGVDIKDLIGVWSEKD